MRVTAVKVGNRVEAVFLVVLGGISVPLLIWVAVIIALRQIFVEWRVIRAGLLAGNLACITNIDCPPGYECIGGTCVPIQAR